MTQVRDAKLSEFYTRDLNPTVKPVLDRVKGNLRAFEPKSMKFPEYQNVFVPDPKDATVFGVLHKTPGRKGTIQLIDGAHRIVAMVRAKAKTTDAFLAIPGS